MPEKGRKWLYDFLSSKELITALLIVLCPALTVTTFSEAAPPWVWQIIRGLFALLVVNLVLCTLRRIKTLAVPVVIMHAGVIVSFVGGGLGAFGYVATVNVYEGETVDTVYRWDMKKDVPLTMDMTVKRLHEEYYPVPVKVGVLRDGEKSGLYVLETGGSFDLENYRIRADAFDMRSQSLKLSVFSGNTLIGHADTAGVMELPADFPFGFRLVAYVDPVVKRTWVDLAFSRNGSIVSEGRTEVNSPLEWEGQKFFHTSTGRDPYRNPFVGLQITRDQGTPVVYLGFCMVALGGVLYLFGKVRA
ncbi:MAG: ResB-like family cytochrome C biogenesis protein [Nitrospirae bacterium]|nr:ResB-like family cytochrome C biogenesis protein [Nitrospirota bacterium]